MKDSTAIRRGAKAYEFADATPGRKHGPRPVTCDDIISDHVDFGEDPIRWHKLMTAAYLMAERRLLKQVPRRECNLCDKKTSKSGCNTRAEYNQRKLCDSCRKAGRLCEGCGVPFWFEGRRDRKRFCSIQCYKAWYKTQPNQKVYRPGRGAFMHGIY